MPISELNGYSDEKLVQLYKEGKEQAFEVLCGRYDRVIRALSQPFFLFGGDDDDLRQEGFFGLLSAVNRYDSDRSDASSFGTFAYKCIRARILNAVNVEKTDKRLADKMSVSIEDILLKEEDLYPISPEETIIGNENLKEISAKIRERLSSYEKKVFDFYLEGYSYVEIAKKLKKPSKSIDNALQRIKEKSKKSVGTTRKQG